MAPSIGIDVSAALGLLATVATAGVGLMIRAKIAEVRTEIQVVRTEVTQKFADLPAILNGTYPRTPVCEANMAALRHELVSIDKRITRIEEGA